MERFAGIAHERSLLQAPQSNVLYPMTDTENRAGENAMFYLMHFSPGPIQHNAD